MASGFLAPVGSSNSPLALWNCFGAVDTEPPSFDRLTKCTTQAPPRERFAEIDWLVGEWTANTGKPKIHVSAKYVSNNHFLSISYGRPGVGASAINTWVITWDPTDNQFVSWNFETNGSISRSICKATTYGLMTQVHVVTPDGSKIEQSDIFRKLDKNSFLFNVQQRTINGIPQPDTPVVKVTRD
jgi:hypothetical protein